MKKIKEMGVGILLLAFLLVSIYMLLESAKPATGPASGTSDPLQGFSMLVLATFLLAGVSVGLLVLRLING